MRLTAGCARTFLLCVVGVVAACNGKHDASRQEQQLAALGTVISISATETTQVAFAAAVTDLERYFLQIGEDWYPWAPGELAAINAALAHGHSVEVSPPLRKLLQRAADIEKLSAGRFNAGLGELSELWGFNQPDTIGWKPPDEDRIATILDAAPGARELLWSDDRASAPGKRMKLDLGGIAKGAILLDAAAILKAHGIDNAIVDIGGDLLVTGQVGGRAARIGIRRPGTHDALAWVEIESGEAVMTSGDYERFFDYNGKRYAHVLDPRTGFPVEGTASVTVIDPDPVLADAAATALFVGGSTEFDALCNGLGIDAALLIGSGGELRLTDGMRSRVHWLPE